MDKTMGIEGQFHVIQPETVRLGILGGRCDDVVSTF